MCDYSLMQFPNRLAVSGEELVVHRFSTNSMGLVSASKEATSLKSTEFSAPSFWTIVKDLLIDRPTNHIAVCIPPGTQLLLRDIPAHLRDHLRVSSIEEVVFTQVTEKSHTYRDAVRFRNGRELSLQCLVVGQSVRVLCVPVERNQEAMANFENKIEAVRG